MVFNWLRGKKDNRDISQSSGIPPKPGSSFPPKPVPPPNIAMNQANMPPPQSSTAGSVPPQSQVSPISPAEETVSLDTTPKQPIKVKPINTHQAITPKSQILSDGDKLNKTSSHGSNRLESKEMKVMDEPKIEAVKSAQMEKLNNIDKKVVSAGIEESPHTASLLDRVRDAETRELIKKARRQEKEARDASTVKQMRTFEEKAKPGVIAGKENIKSLVKDVKAEIAEIRERVKFLEDSLERKKRQVAELEKKLNEKEKERVEQEAYFRNIIQELKEALSSIEKEMKG